MSRRPQYDRMMEFFIALGIQQEPSSCVVSCGREADRNER